MYAHVMVLINLSRPSVKFRGTWDSRHRLGLNKIPTWVILTLWRSPLVYFEIPLVPTKERQKQVYYAQLLLSAVQARAWTGQRSTTFAKHN